MVIWSDQSISLTELSHLSQGNDSHCCEEEQYTDFLARCAATINVTTDWMNLKEGPRDFSECLQLQPPIPVSVVIEIAEMPCHGEKDIMISASCTLT